MTTPQIEAAMRTLSEELAALHALSDQRDTVARRHVPALLKIADFNQQIAQQRAVVTRSRNTLAALLQAPTVEPQ